MGLSLVRRQLCCDTTTQGAYSPAIVDIYYSCPWSGGNRDGIGHAGDNLHVNIVYPPADDFPSQY